MAVNKFYSFQKIYCDLVTDDETVIIVYITWFKIFGFTKRMAAIKLYRADGSTELHRASHNYDPSVFLNTEKPIEAEFQFPEGSFSISYKKPTTQPPNFTTKNGLTYECPVLCSDCNARLELGSQVQTFSGKGYLDYVSLQKLTRFVGLKNLQWGRIHCPDQSIVFTLLQFKKGGPLRFLILKSGSQPPVQSDQFELQWNRNQTAFSLESDILPSNVIHLHPIRTFHDGQAIDSGLFPKYLERKLFELITGDAVEKRWLSGCSVHQQTIPDARAVHEHVNFEGNELSFQTNDQDTERAFDENYIKT